MPAFLVGGPRGELATKNAKKDRASWPWMNVERADSGGPKGWGTWRREGAEEKEIFASY